MEKLTDKYNPKDFEEKLYQEWEEKGNFKPDSDRTKETYCIMMPPPNVTGKLHMGHALDASIQDALIRYKRMRGFRTLWLPGTDHAAISTEMKLVQKLQAEGKTKQDIGYDEFIKEAWDWTKLYGGTIEKQQRKLGCSCDWSKKRFTMDEGLSEAVLEQFVRLYNDGYIYKGKRMVNWCPQCNTSISDAEVIYKEEPSHLWHIRYPIVGEKDKYVEVATTRPETMLGDTAVAVHPDDERYKDLVGKKCILPIMNKEIPIVADSFVEMEFGTGCVKITPAHDPNDYDCGKRHDLEIVEVFTDDFKMGDLVPEYEGMELLEARELIVERLEKEGYLVKTEDLTHNVAKCERCKTTIEPKVSTQWFVKMKDLAKPAIDIVKTGKVKFVPKRYEKQYFHWLENIQDWCISRQLWWGHRIPAYYCDECSHINVAKVMPKKCEKCGSTHLTQDEDTLDTWFSSALWPFSTLGWPDTESEDLKDFYPTDTLVTGYDIITFWVSRMTTQGMYLMNDIPFKDVVIHGIVRDSQGRKMSKTLGNGIDPLDVIDEYGTDSLRYSLVSGTTAGNDIRYMPEKLEQASNFANKVWNAAKFIINSMADEKDVREFCYEVYEKNHKYNPDLLTIEDKWILNKFDKLVVSVSQNIDNYDLGVALDKIYGFIWNEFCDWYIEMVKPRIYSNDKAVKIAVSDILNHVFTGCLKLLHPFMPFLTAQIYSKMICFGTDDLMLAKWPTLRDEFVFDEEEEIVEKLKRLITEIRNVRNNMNVHPSKKSKLILVIDENDNKLKDAIIESKEFISKLGFASDITVQNDMANIDKKAISIVVDDIKAFIPFEDLVDIEEEIERLNNEKSRLQAEVERCEKMLANPGFVNKAPEAKVNQEKEKLQNYKNMLETVEERLQNLM